jgi:hypothetical protein
MKTAQRLRAMAALCRQSAALHPDKSWRLLAEGRILGAFGGDCALKGC